MGAELDVTVCNIEDLLSGMLYQTTGKRSGLQFLMKFSMFSLLKLILIVHIRKAPVNIL